MKINLGCGAKLLPGFVNVDLADNWCKKPPDVVADISKPLPFEDGCADEVHAYHVVEHFPRFEVVRLLTEWIRPLKKGGKLILECPCLDKVLGIFEYFHKTGEPLNFQLTMWALYGDPGHKSEAMMHRWCYSTGELMALLESLGLEVHEEEPQTHVRVRDMRIVGVKP